MNNKLPLHIVSVAVIVGTLPLLFLHRLPTALEWNGLACLALLCAWFASPISRLIAILLATFLWSSMNAQHLIDITDKYSDKYYTVTATIITVNIGQPLERQIKVRVTEVDQKVLARLQQFTLLLRWPDLTEVIEAGQIWRLKVAIRPVHSQLNQGGFDSQRWAVANREVLHATVQQSEQLNRQPSLRQQIVNAVLINIDPLNYADILLALIFGERDRMDAQSKKLLQTTGTAHLMAISGMHIALVAWFGWLLARGVQYFFPTNRINVLFPALLSWVLGLVYVWLSGANPPALRAILALSLWLYLRWRGLFHATWQVWLMIVAALLLIDPLMLLSDGFWLSCCAVAVLIFLFQWAALPASWQQRRRWLLVRWLHLQAGILLLLAPLQLIIFNGISLSSLISNLFAVPIVSLITLPAALIALCSDSSLFWSLADHSLLWLFYLLQQLPDGWLWLAEPAPIFSFATIFSVIIWRCALWRYHYGAIIIALILLFIPTWFDDKAQWRIDMLDVGHGLAVVIHKNNRAIVYDTANRWDDYSIADKTILPFLRKRGLQLEGIILSHQHLDHAGGLNTLMAAFPSSWLRSSSLSLNGLTCSQGDVWYWNELYFEVLWPLNQVEQAQNRDSCVIRVTDGQYSVLLTGDLESAQEQQIVANPEYRSKLSADILQIPHHGSQTSSSALFLRHVRPQLALTSNSRFNPWRLPSDKIKQRYHDNAILWYSTAIEGQLSLAFFADRWQMRSFRQDIKPRWYHDVFGVK